MIDRGVAQTMKQSTIVMRRYLITFWIGCAPLDPPHAEPEVVVGREEEVADQDRLNDEEPREGPAHHREAERLRVGVDLFREPVAGEGQREEGADGDEVADVSHPVVVGPLLVGFGLQELEGRVGGGHRSAERDVRDHSMDVDRHPGEVVDRVRDGDHRSRVRDPARRHHEREPGIRDEHDRGAHDVEADPQSKMHQGMELAPAVVVGVEEEGFREEEKDVREEGGREHAHQVVRELRIQDDEHERQRRAEGRGEREGHREQLRELVREPVVFLVSRLVADRLDDDREDRDGKDERRKQEVELRDHPDGDAAPNDGERPVLRLLVGRRLGLFLRVGQLGGLSLRAGRGVDGRGRRAVRLPVLAAPKPRDHLDRPHEHDECGDGTEYDEQFAVHHGGSVQLAGVPVALASRLRSISRT